MKFNCADDKGNKAPKWIICSDIGGTSYLHEIKKAEGVDVPVFCQSVDKARRFSSLGDLVEALAFIPARLEAYEEDPVFIQGQRSNEFREDGTNFF